MKNMWLHVLFFWLCGICLYQTNGFCADRAQPILAYIFLTHGNEVNNRAYQSAWKSCGGVAAAIGAFSGAVVLQKKHLRACSLVSYYKKKLESDSMNEKVQKKLKKAISRRNTLRVGLAALITALIAALYVSGRYASNEGRAALLIGGSMGLISFLYALTLLNGGS